MGPPLSSSRGLSCPGAERERVDHQREMEQHFGRGVRHALALGVARPGERPVRSGKLMVLSRSQNLEHSDITHIGNSACSSLTIIVGQHRGKGGMLLPSVNRHSPRDGTTHKKAQCHNPAAAEHKRTRHPCERTPPVESGGDATGNAPFLSQPPLRGAHPSGNCTTPRLHAAVAAARV